MGIRTCPDAARRRRALRRRQKAEEPSAGAVGRVEANEEAEGLVVEREEAVVAADDHRA